MPSIDALTMEDISKAIEQTQSSMGITIGKLVPITADMYQAALDVLQECYIPDEPTYKAFGLEYTKEFETLFKATFKENLTFALVDTEDGEIMGLRLTYRIMRGTKEGSLDASNYEDGPFKDMVKLYQTSHEQAKFFETYDANEAFQYFGVCVRDKYRRRGIATLLMRASLKIIEHLGFDTFYVRGNGASNYTQLIFEKLGFETLAEIKYDSYCVDGEFILRGKTGVHESLKEYMFHKTKPT